MAKKESTMCNGHLSGRVDRLSAILKKTFCSSVDKESASRFREKAATVLIKSWSS
jgi:hypothetical protein